MKRIILIIFTIVCGACMHTSELTNEFSCSNNEGYSNLSKIEDFKKLFTVKLPKSWKINLYYDEGQTSIYAADTTLNLTQTTLFDASLIHSPDPINNSFKEKIAQDNILMGLENMKSKDFKLHDHPSFYSLAKGRKGKYAYHILNVFSKVNNDGFLHVKVEVYGDSLVNKRFCKSIDLIHQIQFK